MLPEERAEAAYNRWISQVNEDLRQRVDGTPYRQLFIDLVAAAVRDTQEAVAIGSGTTELPHHG